MSTHYPDSSTFGPAVPTDTGYAYGMGAEGVHPMASPAGFSTNPPPTTPAQPASLDPASHDRGQMPAGLGQSFNYQHAIHNAPYPAHHWSRPVPGPPYPPQQHWSAIPQPSMIHGHGLATYGHTATQACCSSPAGMSSPAGVYNPLTPVPMQPFSPMGYVPFNAMHTMQPYAIGNYGILA